MAYEKIEIAWASNFRVGQTVEIVAKPIALYSDLKTS